MALFKKKVDPISDRARALNAEIAALQAKIQKLDTQVNHTQQPRLRSTAVPHRAGTVTHTVVQSQPVPPPATDPVFEEVDQKKLKAKNETVTTPNHYNDLGVRKYDLHSFIQRLKNHFNPPPTSNPKLVS